MKSQISVNRLHLIKKFLSCVILLIATMNFKIKIVVNGQFIDRQADRAQIIIDDLVKYDSDSGSLSSGSQDKTIFFKKQFLNVPKITLSIHYYLATNGNYQGFNIQTIDVQTDKVILRVTTHSVMIKYLKIMILATDFPNSLQFKETNQSGVFTKPYTAPGKILGYCGFFYGFKGEYSSSTEMHFLFNLNVVDINTISVSYDTTGGVANNIESINYNLLIIYESNTFDSFFYSFIFSVSPNFQINAMVQKEFNISTTLSDDDSIMYGFRYFSVKSNTVYSPSVQTYIGDHPISNSNIKFMMDTYWGSIDSGDINIFQLIMKVCPTDQFIIFYNSQYYCTSDCSTINSMTQGIPKKQFSLEYDNYIMNECYVCYSNCQTCKGPSEEECIGCKSGLYYDSVSSKCLNSKPDKYYCETKTIGSETFYNCSPCHDSCKTCAGPLENNCSSCISGQFFDNIECKCLTSKPDKYFCLPKTVEAETFEDCNPCDNSCKTCIGSLENECSSCASFQFYDNLLMKCLNNKPENYYCEEKVIDSETQKICYPCHNNCKTCTGSLENNCSSCISGQFFDNFESKCLNNKPDKYFCLPKTVDQETFEHCNPCHNSCKTCIGSLENECSSCISGQFFDNFESKCLNNKPDKYFCLPKTVDQETFEHCNPCHNSCKTCIGSLENECSSCISSQFYDTLLMKCLNNKPEKYYCEEKVVDSETQQLCYPCHISCKTCSGSLEDQCSSCAQSQFFDSIEKKCLPMKPENYYCQQIIIDQEQQQICYPCHNSCKTCTGLLPSQCILCALNFFYDSVISECLSTKPENYYCEPQIIDQQTQQICYPCHQSCKTCFGPQFNHCSSCISGQFYDNKNSECLDNQPVSYYCEDKTVDTQIFKSCYPCHQSCLTCSVTQINNCTSCVSNLFYDSVLSKCLSIQPPQMYCQSTVINSQTQQICYPCDVSCNNCSGPLFFHCTSCNQGQFYDNLSSKCLINKPENYYCESKIINQQTYENCYPCHETCKTCSGPLSTQCTSCDSNIYYTFIKED